MMGDIHSKFETEIRYSDKFIIHKLVTLFLFRSEALKMIYSLIVGLIIEIHQV